LIPRLVWRRKGKRYSPYLEAVNRKSIIDESFLSHRLRTSGFSPKLGSQSHAIALFAKQNFFSGC
jgi:hypothetical protein